MSIYNAKPKPRAIFIGFSEDELASSKLASLFPYSVEVGLIDNINNINQSEFDVAICYQSSDLHMLDGHLFVLSVGGHSLPKQIRPENKIGSFFTHPQTSVADEFVIDDGLPTELHKLIQETLLPVFVKNERHNVLNSRVILPTPTLVNGSARKTVEEELWKPLVADSSGKTLAGYFYRSSLDTDSPEFWWLPKEFPIPHLYKWIDFLLKRWREQSPNTFPLNAKWEEEDDWQTVEEREIYSKINELEKEFEESKIEFASKLSALQNEQTNAKEAANKNERALLKKQGTSLKNIVQKTLEFFEFEVIDVDTVKKTKSTKLEDLRVGTTYEGSDWIALAEVRGYKKGAKINDLLRLQRFEANYLQETKGQNPDAIWLIVNHDLQLSPSKRKYALSNSKTEVEEFADGGGLVIDTVELFKLKLQVDEESISKSDARTALCSSTGYFKIK